MVAAEGLLVTVEGLPVTVESLPVNVEGLLKLSWIIALWTLTVFTWVVVVGYRCYYNNSYYCFDYWDYFSRDWVITAFYSCFIWSPLSLSLATRIAPVLLFRLIIVFYCYCCWRSSVDKMVYVVSQRSIWFRVLLCWRWWFWQQVLVHGWWFLLSCCPADLYCFR